MPTRRQHFRFILSFASIALALFYMVSAQAEILIATAGPFTGTNIFRGAQIQQGAEMAIAEGFSLYDAEDRLVLCNSHYCDIYPGIASTMVPWRTLCLVFATKPNMVRFLSPKEFFRQPRGFSKLKPSHAA